MKSKPPPEATTARRPGRPAVDRREEILDAAERLYDSIGFEKTTIGDVARELGMSPANLYRSFPNRRAIDEAIARRQLSVIEDGAWAVARGGGASAQVLKQLSLVVLRETQRILLSEQRMRPLCAVAARERWPVVEAYLDGLRGALRHVIMEGQRSGAFRKADPEVLADTITAALTQVWHPYMIEVFISDDLEAMSDRICDLLVDGLSIK
jgi:AcrR family transcriptional regulator